MKTLNKGTWWYYNEHLLAAVLWPTTSLIMWTLDYQFMAGLCVGMTLVCLHIAALRSQEKRSEEIYENFKQ